MIHLIRANEDVSGDKSSKTKQLPPAIFLLTREIRTAFIWEINLEAKSAPLQRGTKSILSMCHLTRFRPPGPSINPLG